MQKKLLLYYNDLVFSPSEIFLDKDFGQVPITLGRLFNYSPDFLISTNYVNKEFNTYHGEKVIQIKKKFKFLPTVLDFIKNVKVYFYLFSNSSKYDFLIFFPFVPLSDFFFLKIFKAFNKNARIYVKLDANIDFIQKLQSSYLEYNNNFFAFVRVFYYYKRLLKMADIISYETLEVGSILKHSFLGMDDLRDKTINVCNGISKNLIESLGIKIKKFDEKDNIILIIGRHGIWEKNTELVFKATENLKTNWKFIFLGGIEESFIPVIEKYKRKIPDFNQKYIFKGLIRDKREYFEYLNSSKIMILTSNKEGFPLVFSEASYFGNFIITTDVSGSCEATDSGNLGIIYARNNHLELEKHLLKIFSSEVPLEKFYDRIIKYSRNQFVWEEILNKKLFQTTLDR